MIYADYNGTTPIAPEVQDAIVNSLKQDWGNPNTTHKYGKQARDAIEKARTAVATMLNGKPEEVIFTSGGTESNNMVIMGLCRGKLGGQPKHVITTNIEHDSVALPLEHLKDVENLEITEISTVPSAWTAPTIISAIKDNTVLITVMAANNETGLLLPIQEIGEKLKEINKVRIGKCLPYIVFHTDAAQIIGKQKVDVVKWNVDCLTVVGHKFYGPRIGALWTRIAVPPLMFGGGCQERPGTENTPMIVGLGVAASLVTENVEEDYKRIKEARDYLENKLKMMFGSQSYFNLVLSFNSERLLAVANAIESHPDFNFPDNLCDQIFNGGSVHELVNVLINADEENSLLPLKVLQTLSACENGANRLIEIPRAVQVLIQHMMYSSSEVSNVATMVLSNLSRESGLPTVVMHLKPFTATLEGLIQRFIRDHRKEDNFIPMFLCNLCIDINIARCLFKMDVLENFLPYLSTSDSIVVRKGVMGVVKNCVFHVTEHDWLLKNTNVLYYILLPLIKEVEIEVAVQTKKEECKEVSLVMGEKKIEEIKENPLKIDEDIVESFPATVRSLMKTKKAEEIIEIRYMALESLYKLCRYENGRSHIRNNKVYEVLKVYHLWEVDEDNLQLCEDLVNVIIRTEDEIAESDLEKPE